MSLGLIAGSQLLPPKEMCGTQCCPITNTLKWLPVRFMCFSLKGITYEYKQKLATIGRALHLLQYVLEGPEDGTVAKVLAAQI